MAETADATKTDTTTTQGGDATTAPATETESKSTGGEDVAALKQQVADLAKQLEGANGRISELNKESAEKRHKAREAEEQRQKALAEQGEYKALAESQAKTLEELRAQVASVAEEKTTLEQQLEAARPILDGHAKRLEDAKKQIETALHDTEAPLPSHLSTLLRAAPDPLVGLDALQAYRSESGKPAKQPPPKSADGGTSAASTTTSTGGPDFDAVRNDATQRAKLAKEFPEEFRRWIGGNRSRPKASIARK